MDSDMERNRQGNGQGHRHGHGHGYGQGYGHCACTWTSVLVRSLLNLRKFAIVNKIWIRYVVPRYKKIFNCLEQGTETLIKKKFG
jgi:hypothetical protein